MKTRAFAVLFMILLFFASCDKEDQAYSGEKDRTMTFFGEEFTVPLGSVAPITLQDALDRIGPLEGLIKRDDEGFLLLEGSKEIASWSVLDIDYLIEEDDQPYVFEPDAESVGLPTVPMLLQLFGLKCPDQKYAFYAVNPLEEEVPMSATVRVADYFETIREETVKNYVLQPNSRKNGFAEIAVPSDAETSPGIISLDQVRLFLPADMVRSLHDTDQIKFKFSYDYTSHLALGEYLDIPFSHTLSQLQLTLAMFRLHEAVAKLEVVSTLPVEATVEHISLVGENGEEDPRVSFSENITIYGGSPENPVTTPLAISVRAEEGTIPDINGLTLQLRFRPAPGFGAEPIGSSQGISVKSSSITLLGGITLPFGTNEK